MTNALPNQKVSFSGSPTALPSFRHKDNPSIPLRARSNRRHQLPDLHRTDYNHNQHYRYHHSYGRHHHHHHHHHVRERLSAVQTQLPDFLNDRKPSAYEGHRNAADRRERTKIAYQTTGAVDVERNIKFEQAKPVSDFEGIGVDPRQTWKSKISERSVIHLSEVNEDQSVDYQ